MKRIFSPLFLFILFALTLVSTALRAQDKPSESKPGASIKWLSFEEAVALNRKKPKMIFIDIYTDWCGWCKKMDKETFTDPEVVKYINKKFYAVKLNAEQKESIHFKDQNFVNPNPGKSKSTHNLASALLKNERLYPSYVILDKNSDWTYKLKGYQKPETLLPLLHFYGDGDYLKISWAEYLSKVK
jgi:thioredoxin-related protein